MKSLRSPIASAVLAAALWAAPSLLAGDPTAPPAPPLRILAVVESGFLAVQDHSLQFGRDGTRFDFRREGGQDVLFFNQRFSVEAVLEGGHGIGFLYQPLRLETQTSLRRTVRVDGLDFPAGTTVDLLYDFPFYRASYLYDFDPRPGAELAVGFSLQVRNATIVFRSADGTLFRENRDVGPVPLLKLRGRLPLGSGWWTELEADGVWAPISVLNGSDTEVVGALLDASARVGVRFGRVETFLTLRYLGGGAVGTSEDESGPGDGYVRNWLRFVVLTLGIRVAIF